MTYQYRVPESGAHGTITAVRTGGGIRTYISGPGTGLVYVEWDGDGLVCAISLRDFKLEPAEDERRPSPLVVDSENRGGGLSIMREPPPASS